VSVNGWGREVLAGRRVREARIARSGRALVAVCFLQACASGPPPAPPVPEWTASRTEAVVALEAALARDTERPAGALRVRLAFSGQVDLDLYVTDPKLETLYYANSPVRSGGDLATDHRCEADSDDAPRIETARFAAPLDGRYRVGVDYPAACGGDEEVVPYALSVEWDGGSRDLRGLAELRRFDSIVLELDLP
jgi:hypothetical protein